ncbi:MAG TPA: T9SS type A sorting domain-containing protein, partial [Caldithrix abyssi]|nr:T9SS type A sorting domain-containing protein [Caldithrix abyssi]
DLESFYAIDDNVYLRFRLYADANTNGWGWAFDDVTVTNTVSDIDPKAIHANRFELVGNYPNPFGGNRSGRNGAATEIAFTLAKNGPVELTIYNVRGQKVRTLLNGAHYTAGQLHTIRWNGTNEAGHRVSSGTYFYRLSANGQTQIKKMLFLR